MKSSNTIKSDCFACSCIKRVYDCKCLTTMICKFSDRCPFYKSKDIISTKEIEKSIKNYAI